MKRFAASIDKYAKEARIKNDEQVRWNKRFKEANKVLFLLKTEIIEKKLLTVLKTYLAKKRSETEMSRIQLKAAHVNKINEVYQVEIASFTKIILEAAELLQENFLVLRSCGELDNRMMEKFNSIEKLMQGQRNVKFSEETDVQVAPTDAHLEQFLNLTDYDQNGVATNARKRFNEEEEDEIFENELKKSKNSTFEDFQFARPSALKSINFGMSSTTGMNADQNMNQTFAIDGISANETVILSERVPSSNLPSTSSGIAFAFLNVSKTFNRIFFF